MTALALPIAASAGTRERIRQDKIIRISYRADAPPFSYKDSIGEPAGYMVDLLCEPTSATLSRRELVDFSITTLVDGASLVIATDGPENLQALAGRTIGVLVGTTTEQSLHHSLSNAGITAEVTPAKTHAEGLGMLENGKISAYFADRSILIFLVKDSKASEKLRLADAYPTVEPYALALQKGTRACVWKLTLRSVTSTALVKSAPFLRARSGGNLQLGAMLRAAFLFSSLPD